MGTTETDRFRSSLAELGVSLTRLDPTEFASTIDSVVDEPAVGVPFENYEGLSLEETVVQTPPTPRLLREAATGVTPITTAIADYGTLLVDSDAAGTEPVSLYPPTHVAVVRESDIVPDVESVMGYLGERFDAGTSTVFATGASATGDMGALVEGVHGPGHVHVCLLEGR